MTTNIDRAAEIIRWAPIRNRPEDTADELAAKGLLMPDLPEMTDRDDLEWESSVNGNHAVSVNDALDTIRIWGNVSRCNLLEARTIALALLAAANYAEGNS